MTTVNGYTYTYMDWDDEAEEDVEKQHVIPKEKILEWFKVNGFKLGTTDENVVVLYTDEECDMAEIQLNGKCLFMGNVWDFDNFFHDTTRVGKKYKKDLDMDHMLDITRPDEVLEHIQALYEVVKDELKIVFKEKEYSFETHTYEE